MKFDIGCGRSKRDGFIGVDVLGVGGVDINHDLNMFPYPIEESSATEIVLDNVLEHLDRPLAIIEEIYRICKDDAIVTVMVPYFRSFYSAIDPTHKRFFGIYSLSYFDPSHVFYRKYSYTKVKFNILEIAFEKRRTSKNPVRKIVRCIANRWPELYESKLSHLYPLDDLTYVLRADKS